METMELLVRKVFKVLPVLRAIKVTLAMQVLKDLLVKVCLQAELLIKF